MVITKEKERFIRDNYMSLTPEQIAESIHIKDVTIRRYMTVHLIPMRRRNGTFFQPTGIKKTTKKELFDVNKFLDHFPF